MTNPNDPAFSPASAGAVPDPGLTKREDFAARAMQGLIAGNYEPLENIPRQAIALANKLIAELNKEQPK